LLYLHHFSAITAKLAVYYLAMLVSAVQVASSGVTWLHGHLVH